MTSRLYIIAAAITAISFSSSSHASPMRVHAASSANIYISKALSTAKSIPNPFIRIDTLHSIARAQTLLGDYAGVQHTAQLIASSKSEPEIRSSTVGEIGDDLVWVGQRNSGIAILRVASRQALTIQEPRSRSLNLWVIARWFESAGDVPDTLLAVTHITDGTVRSRGQAVRAGAYAKAGAFVRALSTARAIPEPDIRNMALEEIAVIQYKTGATKAGLATIRSIKQADSAKVMGLTQIAGLQWLAGKHSVSSGTTDEAYKAATLISDPRDQVLALSTLQQQYVRMHQHDKACALIDLAIASWKTIADASAKENTQQYIVDMQLKVGDTIAAEATADTMGVTAPFSRNMIVMIEAGSGNLADARAHALKYNLVGGMRMVAYQQFIHGHRADAMGSIRQAQTMALAHDGYQNRDIQSVAQTQAAIGDIKGAAAWVSGMKSPEERAAGWSGIAMGLMASRVARVR